MSEPELRQQWPCQSDPMSALAPFNTGAGGGRVLKVVSQLHRPIDRGLRGHSCQIQTGMHMYAFACTHICEQVKHLKTDITRYKIATR